MRAARTKPTASPAQTAPAIATATAIYTPPPAVASTKPARASRSKAAAPAASPAAPVVAPVSVVAPPPTGHIPPAAKAAKSSTPVNRRRKAYARIPADAVAAVNANPALASDGLTAAAVIQRTFNAKRMPVIVDATAEPDKLGYYLGVAFIQLSLHIVQGKPVELLTAHCRPYNPATGTYSTTARHRMIPLASLLVAFDKQPTGKADDTAMVVAAIYTGLSPAKIADGMTIWSAYEEDRKANLN